MAHLLSIPEHVMAQHVFPNLDHNDRLRLRRVCKQTKAMADAYLWTPLPGHQGKWELTIDQGENLTLQAFLQMGLPPPSQLSIENDVRSFFEDEHLEEFMKHYGRYVTSLTLSDLFFPFTSATEINFFESLVNLEKLYCFKMTTVGGAAQFEEKTRNAEGSFLIRPTFKKLKVLKLFNSDCGASMWNFINGVSNNLDKILHPMHKTNRGQPGWDVPVQQLIERRRGGMQSQRKLVYDWSHFQHGFPKDDELLRIFACCHDNGVFIRNLNSGHLDGLYDEANGRVGEQLVENPVNVIPERNQFVGNIIQSLGSLNEAVFLLELPALEKITLTNENLLGLIPRQRYPVWPNLKRMEINMTMLRRDDLRFLQGGLRLPKLEELELDYLVVKEVKFIGLNLPIPRNLGISCGNMRKLTIISCPGNDDFFLRLWEELPLLEEITLDGCRKLTNNGFVGDGVDGNGPVFLKLEKLKRLSILSLQKMPRITDAVFSDVFRHLELSAFELSSDKFIKSITMAGIQELLTGPFADSIGKLDLDKLKLNMVSQKKLKELVSCFRSSKMI